MIRVRINKDSLPRNIDVLIGLVKNNLYKAKEIVEKEKVNNTLVKKNIFGKRIKHLDHGKWLDSVVRGTKGMLGVEVDYLQFSFEVIVKPNDMSKLLSSIEISLQNDGEMFLSQKGLEVFSKIQEECINLGMND